jgi:Protein of unknown function DUF262
MSLEDEVRKSRKEITTDGYEMSLGEIMSLYSSKELIINPQYQRYFRWDISQKTKFIESILLGIPLPAIFVFQSEQGVWELVDGLQRISTILEFTGLLRKEDSDALYPPSILEGTKMLPSLARSSWNGEGHRGLPKPLQLDFKRARMRVEILKRESDPQSKYELFQRLNTGGSTLTEQEIRNCVMVMIDPTFATWVNSLTEYPAFRNSIAITDNAERRQKASELVLRFIVYRHRPYEGGLDVHEYLDDGLIHIASDSQFNRATEAKAFKDTFGLIFNALGDDAFRRYDGSKFSGMFLISAFEAITIGVSQNLDRLKSLAKPKRSAFVRDKVKALWKDSTFRKNSGAGVRGTTRLSNLLPLAESFFRI